MRFIEAFNESLESVGVIGVKKGEGLCKMVITPLSINKKGNFKGYADVYDKNDTHVARIDGLSERGGVYGTFGNLMGDGLENLGESLGDRICAIIKAYRAQ